MSSFVESLIKRYSGFEGGCVSNGGDGVEYLDRANDGKVDDDINHSDDDGEIQYIIAFFMFYFI